MLFRSGGSADRLDLSHSSSSFIARRFFGPAPDTDPRLHLDRHTCNASSSDLLAPIAAHDLTQPVDDDDDDEQKQLRRYLLPRRAHLALLSKRQFACPIGTTSCENIGFQNSCCVAGETCFVVRDTGLGPVGCCPAGITCSGGIAGCPADHAPCPSLLGGGCCIPGFICAGVGCVFAGGGGGGGNPSVVITTTRTSVVPGPAPTTIVVTVVITQPASGGGGTVTISTTVTSVGPAPPPPSTTTVVVPATTTTTGEGNPAVRPTATTVSDDGQLTIVPTAPGACPVGYYGCLARAAGGCCRTGRECDTTHCPPVGPYTTIVNVNGVTVVVPLPADGGSLPTPAPGSCADGWQLCPDEAGPIKGCCPTGYACGTASCTGAFPQGTATVAKVLPGRNGAGSGRAAAGLSWPLGAAVAGWLVLW